MSCIVTMCSPSPRALHSVDMSWARAEVFISATTRELRSYREEVKNALLTLGIFPIEQTNFRLGHGPLTAKLRSLIAPCDTVIHPLRAFTTGRNPRNVHPVNPAALIYKSNTMWRENSGIRFSFFSPPRTAGSTIAQNRAKKKEHCNLRHRRAIEECDDVYYSLANHEDLPRLVHCICCFFTMRLLINNTTRRIRRSQQDGVR
jgi:hypothetical protein